MSNAYCVEYRVYSTDVVNRIGLLAESKEDAYNKAVYELIPEKEGSIPYSAWVHSVTYQNGNMKVFKTIERKPFLTNNIGG